MRRLFTVIILSVMSVLLLAQHHEYGLPGIKNYTPKNYKQESQNFSIASDSVGMMYFGNTNGIMEFDSETWRLIKIPGKPLVKRGRKGEVYFGGYNVFGRLQKENGITTAKTFDLPDSEATGQIVKILPCNDCVLFTTEHRLYVLKNDTVDLELSNALGLNIFALNGKVLIYIPNRGLYCRENDKIKKDHHFALIDNLPIEDIIKLNDSCNIIKVKGNNAFYKYVNDSLSRFYTDVDAFIGENIYSTGIKSGDNTIVFGTLHGGIVCIDTEGKFVFALNKFTGLCDNRITDLYCDNDQKLWVTTNNGIALLETQSDICFFQQFMGFSGTVLSIKRYNHKIYIGTSNGVFYLNNHRIGGRQVYDYSQVERFAKLEIIKARCWLLDTIGDHLFAFTESGIFDINGDNASLVLPGEYYCFGKISADTADKSYVIGTSKGLMLCSVDGKNFTKIHYVDNFKFKIRSICKTSDRTFWLGSIDNGLFKLVVNDISTGDVEITPQQLPVQYSWIYVYPTCGSCVFATDKGSFVYNARTKTFARDTLLDLSDLSHANFLYPIVKDDNNDLWYCCNIENLYEQETGVFRYNGKNKKYTRCYMPFMQLNEYKIGCIYPENNGVTWFGSSDALIKFDGRQHRHIDSTSSFPCLIRKVTINEDSVINYSTGDICLDRCVNIDYYDRGIRFDFVGLSYHAYGKTAYQVRLLGFNDKWSDWTYDTYKEYTSLKNRSYEFNVRAKDVYGNISDVASVHVNVKLPFYLTWMGLVIYILMLFLIFYVIFKLTALRHKRERMKLERLVESRTKELRHQKEHTETLLKKLLPENTADEIKETGNAMSKKYELVTVLFADIQGFTKISEHTQPEELFKHLSVIFDCFDKIISKYNIEKIKTIGDAYMCAGGLPDKDTTNPMEVVLAALEMQRELRRINETGDIKFEIRIGVHSGPVISGVVGVQKIEYDIWGDTVNTASRMESHGVIGNVNISETTYDYVKEFFNCELRGAIDIKYKGKMNMYFVNSIRKELSINGDGINPNEKFDLRMQFVRFKQIQENTLLYMQENLPQNLYYHNVKHTTNVLYMVEILGKEEGVSEDDMLLLKCAALFHDTGFLVSYDNNETIGAKMAQDTLKKYKFRKEQIAVVKRLIIATRMPVRPRDLLESIICDADLDYLGRPDFIPISQNLFRELFERGKIDTIEQWNKMQYKFLQNHNFFTATARAKRNPGKESVLQQMKEIVS